MALLFGRCAKHFARFVPCLVSTALSLTKQRANLIVDIAQNNQQNSPNFRGENDTLGPDFRCGNGKISNNKAIISIERYRKLTGHKDIPEDVILRRLHFIEGLCRHVAKQEIRQYAKKKSATKS